MTFLPEGISKRIISDNHQQFDNQPTPTAHSTVSIVYWAYLHDTGVLFESSSSSSPQASATDAFIPNCDENIPVRVSLGKLQCIRGLELAVQTMRRGELSEFLIEPQYAYGSVGGGERVPPNSTVRFVVHLLGWDDRVDIVGDGSILKTVISNNNNDIAASTEEAAADKDGDAHVRVDGRVRVAYQAYAGSSVEPFETHTALEFIIGDDAVWIALERCVQSMTRGETASFECDVVPNLFEEFAESDSGFLQRARTTPPTATVRFDVTLHNFENMPSAYRCESPLERLEIAAFYKARGTALFQRGRFKRASQVFCAGVPYARGDGVLSNNAAAAQMTVALKTTEVLAGDQQANSLPTATRTVLDELNTLYIALHLNEAACALKLADYDDVDRTCNEVLKRDAYNAKALLRLAAMYVARDELSEAERCCDRLASGGNTSDNDDGLSSMRRQIAAARDAAEKRQKKLFAGKQLFQGW